MSCANVPYSELENRLIRFRKNMDTLNPDWEICAVFSKINQFYFTGTMQNGVLIIPRDSEAIFFVRKSYHRALDESEFPHIIPIKSFREVAAEINTNKSVVYVEKESLPIAHFERFNKHLGFRDTASLDVALLKTRALKSDFEVDLIKTAGEIHYRAMEKKAPEFLSEGISEAEFGSDLIREMIRLGHHGVTRLGTYNAELYLGNISFGDSGNYYNSFDGPAGLRGFSPAVPLLGSFERKLRKNSVALADTGCCYCGYYTDKTTIYSLGKIPNIAYDYHERCVEIQNKTAELLKPGETVSSVYEKVTKMIDDDFDKDFMGFGPNKVKFLGHGIGLVIDEYPPIAKGFNEEIRENMVFAIEPKKGIKDFGMVGIENTFLITDKGGVSLTGDKDEIITVD